MSGIPDAPPLDDSKALVPVAPPLEGSGPAPPAPTPVASSAAPAISSPTTTTLTTGVPSMEPALNKIQPVPIKKTIMAINNFVINSVEFLNKFTMLCEQKLAKASESIQRLEIVLTLLEGKLDSIDYLAGTGPSASASSASSSSSSSSSAAAAPASAGSSSAPPAPPMGDVPAAPPMEAVPETPPEPEQPSYLTDPQYLPYFKLLKLKVPREVVGKKMEREGVDPDIAALILQGGEDGAAKAIAAQGGMAAKPAADSESDQEEQEDDFD